MSYRLWFLLGELCVSGNAMRGSADDRQVGKKKACVDSALSDLDTPIQASRIV
jgi:hypothetical protein